MLSPHSSLLHIYYTYITTSWHFYPLDRLCYLHTPHHFALNTLILPHSGTSIPLIGCVISTLLTTYYTYIATSWHFYPLDRLCYLHTPHHFALNTLILPHSGTSIPLIGCVISTLLTTYYTYIATSWHFYPLDRLCYLHTPHHFALTTLSLPHPGTSIPLIDHGISLCLITPYINYTYLATSWHFYPLDRSWYLQTSHNSVFTALTLPHPGTSISLTDHGISVLLTTRYLLHLPWHILVLLSSW